MIYDNASYDLVGSKGRDVARLVRHALNRGNLLEGPLTDWIADAGNPGCQGQLATPPEPIRVAPGDDRNGATARVEATASQRLNRPVPGQSRIHRAQPARIPRTRPLRGSVVSRGAKPRVRASAWNRAQAKVNSNRS
jgi:hypothetical protein